MADWTQKELEDLFIRKNVYERDHEELERDIRKLEKTMEWWGRLMVTQAVLLVGGLILFIVERTT